MTLRGLGFYILKKLNPNYLRDMAQLADRVRQVERLKVKKVRANRSHKKERVAYVEAKEGKQEIYDDSLSVEEGEVDLVELKQEPPYPCKMLTCLNGKNPIELENSDKFLKKMYTFDVMKCDEIFDLLVKYGQMIVPYGSKVPQLEQRKKISFCKYHNFLGYDTSKCFLFRDLIQNAIKEGRLRFREKRKNQIKVDVDPMPIANSNYVEPANINMV